MYLSFYKLSEKPFSISADPRFLWLGEKHNEAFANLKYGLLEVNGYVVLTGDVGTGKTTLVNALLDTLDESVEIANINHPTLDTVDFFKLIARAYDPSVEIASKAEFLIFLNAFLKRSHAEGKAVLLIIDEAHRLSKELLEEIRLFSNIEQEGTKLITIFFVGQDEFKEIIQWPECRALRQRITLFYDIEPLSAKETEKYIAHRMKIAGAIDPLFSSNAIKKIHRFTKGYPRLINILCDRAMLTGYVQEQSEIDASIIRECAREMKFLHPVQSIGPGRRTGAPGTPVRSLFSRLRVPKSDFFRDINRRRLMATVFAGLLALLVTAAGISMNFKSSSTKNDIAAKDGADANQQHSNVSVRQQREPTPPPADNAEQPVSEKDIAVAVKKGPQTLKRETAKVKLETSEGKIAQHLPSTQPDAVPAATPESPTQLTPFELAAVAVEEEKFQLGIDLLETDRKKYPHSDAATSQLYARALVGRAEQVGLSSETEAQALLRKAVEANPQNVDAHFDLGKVYTQSKDYALAIEAYRNVVRLDPEFSDAFFNMGFIYAATGKYDEAEKLFMRVVELAPGYQDKALFNLAVIQEKLGKREECLANLHKAVVLEPGNEKAQSYLKRLLGGMEAGKQ